MSSAGPELVINILGLPGSGKSAVIARSLAPVGFKVFRPSDVIRHYAAEHDIRLTSRADYARTHRWILKRDPEAMTRPILEAKGWLVLDGLRAYSHAHLVKQALGSERYRTAVLDCPQTIRCKRVINDPSRKNRDAARLTDLRGFQQDELTDLLDPHLELPLTMCMHDLTPQLIDANRPLDEVAAKITEAVSSLIISSMADRPR